MRKQMHVRNGENIFVTDKHLRMPVTKMHEQGNKELKF